MHQQADAAVAQTLLAQVQKAHGAALTVAVVGLRTGRARKRQAWVLWVLTQGHWEKALEVMLVLVAARLAAVLAATLRRLQLTQKQMYMHTEWLINGHFICSCQRCVSRECQSACTLAHSVTESEQLSCPQKVKT